MNALAPPPHMVPRMVPPMGNQPFPLFRVHTTDPTLTGPLRFGQISVWSKVFLQSRYDKCHRSQATRQGSLLLGTGQSGECTFGEMRDVAGQVRAEDAIRRIAATRRVTPLRGSTPMAWTPLHSTLIKAQFAFDVPRVHNVPEPKTKRRAPHLLGYPIHTTLLSLVIAGSVATKQTRASIGASRSGLLHPRPTTRVRNDESRCRASEEPPLRRKEV
jgi:hypothetical protein